MDKRVQAIVREYLDSDKSDLRTLRSIVNLGYSVDEALDLFERAGIATWSDKKVTVISVIAQLICAKHNADRLLSGPSDTVSFTRSYRERRVALVAFLERALELAKQL